MSILTGTAPDGTIVTIDLAEDGPACAAPAPKMGLGCTLGLHHEGPWHIADTGTEIMEVWECPDNG